MNDFWDSRKPGLSSEFQTLLTKYSQISSSNITDHLERARDRAWNVRRYPCIGNYMFTDLSMSHHAAYAEVLEALRSDAMDKTLLDIGCCLGQDLRKLVFDGASGKRLTGCDIEPGFFSVGYELFQDRSRLQAEFLSGDFLDEVMPAVGLEPQTQEILDPSLENWSTRRYDFIHAADVFHLWSWDKQIQAYTKAVHMLKDRPGCILFGRNTGVVKAMLLDQGPFASPSGDHTWLHDAESMRAMLKVVTKAAERELDFVVEDVPILDERILALKAVTELGWTRRLSFFIRTV